MMIRAPLLLFISLVQSAFAAVGPLRAQSPPAGLEVQLRTAANKTTFQLFEIVPLEVTFRSSKPSTYSIELADGWNPAAAADRFLVEPGDDVIDRQAWTRPGTVCCDSRRAFLTSTPSVHSDELTDFLRFTRPGHYRIQYTSRRVFSGPPTREYKPSDILVHSNVLAITITEGDADWADRLLPTVLAQVEAEPIAELRALANRSLRAEAPTESNALARYRRAVRQLRMLDTPIAIRTRVSHLRMPSVDEWRTSEAIGNGYNGVDNSVAYSSRPDLIAAALRERASAPDFGIMRGYFELWANVLLERDHPALVRLRAPGSSGDQKIRVEQTRAARQSLLNVVRQLSGSKVGVAAEITAATLRQIERDLTRVQ